MAMSGSARSHKFLLLALFAAALITSAWTVVAVLGWQKKKNGPDLEGIWHGSGWGSVRLERTGPGIFQGTYTSTYGRYVGRISLSWNPGAGRYEGTWGEGAYRHGRVWVRPDERAGEFSGTFSADPDC